jgi:hypothetical protein
VRGISTVWKGTDKFEAYAKSFLNSKEKA